MAMDLRLTDWLAATETASDAEAGSLATVGDRLLREEPSLPLALTAECHVRVAALHLRSGDAPLALRHANHAATLALDMPAEAQLNVLPRAIGVAKTAEHLMGDALPSAHQINERAAGTVGQAMTMAIDGADRGLVELAVVQALHDCTTEMDDHEREQMNVSIRQHSARLALQLETAGELQLAAQARTITETNL